MSVFADLHVHTRNSDGEMELSEVPAAARDAGVSVVAITDHDRLHPELPTPVTAFEGVTVVHGIELRVEPEGDEAGSSEGDGGETSGGGESGGGESGGEGGGGEGGGERVDLLGYGATPTPDLVDELERIQADRKERGRKIIENVEDELGIDLELEAREGLGRPHVARAVVDHPESGYDDTDDVFDDLIGEDGPCFVARDVTSFERGVELLSDACGLVGLAHPYRYDAPETALELTRHLDAVERYYPYDAEVDPRPVERAIAEHDLIPTGGSDAHDDALARAGLSKPEYRHFRSTVNL